MTLDDNQPSPSKPGRLTVLEVWLMWFQFPMSTATLVGLASLTSGTSFLMLAEVTEWRVRSDASWAGDALVPLFERLAATGVCLVLTGLALWARHLAKHDHPNFARCLGIVFMGLGAWAFVKAPGNFPISFAMLAAGVTLSLFPRKDELRLAIGIACAVLLLAAFTPWIIGRHNDYSVTERELSRHAWTTGTRSSARIDFDSDGTFTANRVPAALLCNDTVAGTRSATGEFEFEGGARRGSNVVLRNLVVTGGDCALRKEVVLVRDIFKTLEFPGPGNPMEFVPVDDPWRERREAHRNPIYH